MRFIAGVVFAVAALTAVAAAYKPVVLVRGYHGSEPVYDQFVPALAKAHPGQQVILLNNTGAFRSSESLSKQLASLQEQLHLARARYPDVFENGFHLVANSQGALVARAAITAEPLNVEAFVSLAGVQAGFFGQCSLWFAKSLTCHQVTNAMYTKVMQRSFSIAQMWRAPYYYRYTHDNTFLAYYNNENDNYYNETFAPNFMRTKHVHFLGSPADEVLHPWYTALFDFYDFDEKTRVPHEKQFAYRDDLFGLKTLTEAGRVTYTEVPNVKHMQWVKDEAILREHVFPLLY